MIALALSAIATAVLTFLLLIAIVEVATRGRWLVVAPAVVIGAALGSLVWVVIVIIVGRLVG